jgi:hypothetical protein
MKKILVIATVFSLCIAGIGPAFAEEHGMMHHKGKMMSEDSGMKSGEKCEKKCAEKYEKKHEKRHGKSMRGMMGMGMMKKSVVATSDGGVVVSIGDQLIKYDSDLNLVKKVEIEVDKSDMKRMMKKCSKWNDCCKKQYDKDKDEMMDEEADQ